MTQKNNVLRFPTPTCRSVPIREESAVVIVIPVIRIEREYDDALTMATRESRRLSIAEATRQMTQRLKDEMKSAT